jgi:predicted flap endonuclease-1-like 5' DNA nuclease
MKILDVEGIGPGFAEQLRSAGVETTDDLLARAGSREGRERLAEETGLTARQVLAGWIAKAESLEAVVGH